ncbi:MAG: MBL fold metallo-hydrolase [Gemmatimonadales bacterium]
MTTLYLLGSGSGGNCLAVQHEGSVLLVDAGFSAKEIERRAVAAGLPVDAIIGIVLTHEHGDHACGASRLVQRLGVPLLATQGTWNHLRPRMATAEHRPVALLGSADIGPFTLHTCPTSHDAVEPIALVVQTRDGVRIGVAYDLGRATAAVRYLLSDLDALVLEANHDEVLLRTNSYPASVRQRIAGSGGHLSNRAAADLITGLLHPGLGIIVLAHLSEQCNSELQARETVGEALAAAGYGGELHVARQDRPLPPLEVRRWSGVAVRQGS